MRRALLFCVPVLIAICFAWLMLGVQGSPPALAQDGFPPKGQPNTPDIVGGEEAEPGAWPWQVALLHADSVSLYDGQYCGGTLIDPYWVLTAAHCVDGRSTTEIDLVVGVHDLINPEPGYQRLAIRGIIIHPDYNAPTYDSDIALILLEEPANMEVSEGELPVAAVDLVPADAGLLSGVMSMVTGWGNRLAQPYPGGYDFPETLHQVQLPILTNEACDESFDYYIWEDDHLTENMLCAGYLYKGSKDACQGDSGGPLVIFDEESENWQQAGIVSWGYGCANPGLPGVYTRVSNFSDWIQETITTPTARITKEASRETADHGDTILYTLNLENWGSIALTGLVMSDTIPSNSTLVPGSITDGGIVEDGAVYWDGIDLPVGESVPRQFAVSVNEDAPYSKILVQDNIEGDISHWQTSHDPALGAYDWFVADYYSHSGLKAWLAYNAYELSDQYLTLTVPEPLPEDTFLSFWHLYDIEYFYDGGVVEISTDTGLTWEDLGDYMLQNGYNTTLSNDYSNPIGGRPAFTGFTYDWIETIVDLNAYAGEEVLIRFRLGTDTIYGYFGWLVDDVSIYFKSMITNQAFVNGESSNTVQTEVMFIFEPTDTLFVPFTASPDSDNPYP